MKEPLDPPYRCVKTRLKNVVKDDLVIKKLTHAVLRANGIMLHTLQLLKLYLLHCCEKDDELPTLDKQFVTSVMKALCEQPPGQASKSRDEAHQGDAHALLRAALQGIRVGGAKLPAHKHRARLPLDRRHHHVREQRQAELRRVRRVVRQRVVAQEGAGRRHQEELEEDKEPPGCNVCSLAQGQGRPAPATPAEDVAPPLPRVDRRAAPPGAPCDGFEKGQRPLRHLVLAVGLPPVYNRKTTYFERFKAYVEKKNEMNRRLSPVYNEYIFRKLKLGSYMRRQITEARLLKRFEKLFGSGTETIVTIGNWDQRQHRRFTEPVKGKELQDGVSEGGLRRVSGR